MFNQLPEFYEDIKAYPVHKAIAHIEASRIAYNQNNPYGEVLDFAGTVEMLEDSACCEDEDYRALKAILTLRNRAMTHWYNGLSDIADPKTVAKIQQTFG